MILLRYLVGLFIDAFGVTRPGRGEQDRAALYITTLVLAIVALIGFGAILALRMAAG